MITAFIYCISGSACKNEQWLSVRMILWNKGKEFAGFCLTDFKEKREKI